MWEPAQYERFKAERQQPFHDLVSHVEHRPSMRVADLGCGTGEMTRFLHEQLGAQETIGIDNSESMLRKSGEFATEAVHFQRADIESFVADHPFDLIFSNAALHWVPDHNRLFANLASLLTPSGQLAVQMPANDGHLSHTTAAEIAEEFGVAPRRDHLLPAEKYAELLHHLGFKRQSVRMQVYGHLLDSTADVVEWVRGALLTDYERRLSDRYADFLERYTATLLYRLGDERPYFYTYKRILIWASF